jgi:C1A family cysteine protease
MIFVMTARGLGALMPEDPADRFDLYSERAIQAVRMDRSSPPASYDARSQGLVSPVKNQGSCGSCASFSATAVVETCLYKAGGLSQAIDLSEQWMMDCGKDGK